MNHRFTRFLPAAGATAASIAAAVLVAAGAGPAQAASANLFASVSASGTLVTGNGVSSVTHIGTGQYEVTFSSNVASCAYEATTGLDTIEITVDREIYSATVVAARDGFTLRIECYGLDFGLVLHEGERLPGQSPEPRGFVLRPS